MYSEVPTWIVEYAEELAGRSALKHKMAAVIYKDGEILGADYNRWFGNTANSCVCLYGVPVKSRHAEQGAIIRVYKHYGSVVFKGSEIYVHRLGGRYAKPCSHCTQVIYMMGIDSVHWSGD